LKENPPSFSKVEDTEIEFSAFKGEFSTFERKGADIVEESEDTTTLLKQMVGYMKTFVDKSDVVNLRLGDIKVSLDGMHDTLKSVKEDTAQIPYIVKNTEKIIEHTSHIPRIEENTSLIPAMREDIAEMKSHTSIIPAMREDTHAIRTDTKEIAAKLWEKYEELSKEIAQMKITLARIEAKVFS
jgi:alkyl hydroperoxide reductase subunit AhpC